MAILRPRTQLTGAAIAVAMAIAGAGVAGCASSAAGGSSSSAATTGPAIHTPVRPQLSQHQLLQIALGFARRAGDPHPTLIQHSAGTRRAVNRIASGDIVPGSRWSYLIAEMGHFVLTDVSVPPGAKSPSGSVLTLVVDARTGNVTDRGVSDRYPALDQLGQPVSTDLRRAQPGSAPNVTGLTLPAAYARLHRAGLRVTFDGVLNAGTDDNSGCTPTITTEHPAPGATVKTHQVVTLAGTARCGVGSPALPVGRLPAWVVPDFIGKPLSVAIGWAARHHLYWSTGRLPQLRDADAATLPANYRVTWQAPHAGAKLSIGVGTRRGNSGTLRLTPLSVMAVLRTSR